MTKYKYSVVIPHFNSSIVLTRMIDSIPEREDVQVIVADDCSRDEEYEAIRGIEHMNLEVYRLSKNGGAGAARNLGLAHVRGSWVTFVDADDTLAPEAFDVFDKHIDPTLDYLCYFVKPINDATGETLDRALQSEKSVRAFFHHPNRRNRNLFLFRTNVCWNKLVRTDFIRKYHIRFEECQVNNDVLYALLVGLYGEHYKIIPQELYVWRENMSSMTRKKRSLEREFAFYLQAQKRNGLFRAVGLKRYPFYRSDLLYALHFIKGRGVADTFDFFEYKRKMHSMLEMARQEYTHLIEPLFFMVRTGLNKRIASFVKSLSFSLRYGSSVSIPMSVNYMGKMNLTIINGGGI